MDTSSLQYGQGINKPSPSIRKKFLEVGSQGNQTLLLLVKEGVGVKGSKDVPVTILYKEDMTVEPDGFSLEYTISTQLEKTLNFSNSEASS